jgi:Family of unknown function (DUF6220)
MKHTITSIGKYLYLIFSWLFVAGVIYQVYLTGLAVVAQKQGWSPHIAMGHTLGLPLLLMIITMLVGRLPRSIKVYTLLLFLIYVLQADILIFMRRSLPFVSALHPVLALADFALGLWLALQALAFVRTPGEPGTADGKTRDIAKAEGG